VSKNSAYSSAAAIALSLLTFPSWASDEVGIGALTSSAPGALTAEYAFIVEGGNHFQQRETVWGITQYGFAQSRLELGTSVGISLDADSGVTLIGLGKNDRIAPHLGIEPFSGTVSLNTKAGADSFYEWMPMASAGVQVAAGSCRLLPLVRAGGGVGNLRKAGLLPGFSQAVGASAHINCGLVNLAGSWVKVGPLPNAATLGAVDLSVALRSLPIRFGARAETLDGGTAEFARPSESRFLVVFRGTN
jgi:hypothetical protein